MCPKYFNLPVTAKVSRECLGLICLITDAFVLAVHGILNTNAYFGTLSGYS
jgi:hypothetical protein